MKKKNIKKIMAVVLSIIMIMTIVPLAAFAKEDKADDIKLTDKLIIKTKAPVSDVQYSKKGELLPEFEPKIEAGHGYKAGKSSWIYFNDENKKGIITEMFVPGGDYLFSVGVMIEDGYKLPEKITDIPVVIDYDGADDVVLKKENYRTPDDFDFREKGTYTIQPIKSDDGVREFDFMFAAKPFNAVEDEIELMHANPVVGEECLGKDLKYMFEANSADGVTVGDTKWEEKVIGNIYKPADKFKEGKIYRVNVTLVLKDGYEFPEDLSKIKVTLVDGFYNETKLDSKDFKITFVETGDMLGAYSFVYEFPDKLTAPTQKPEDDKDTTVKPAEPQPDAEKPKDDIETPNTGAPVAAAAILLAVMGAGVGVVTKKRKI